jgi:hypothetical protein
VNLKFTRLPPGVAGPRRPAPAQQLAAPLGQYVSARISADYYLHNEGRVIEQRNRAQ